MTIKNIIQGRYGLSGNEFTKGDVEALVRESGQSYSDGYVSLLLHKMLSDNVIVRSSRGRYRFAQKQKNIFRTHPDEELKSICEALGKQFPFVDFCVWNTKDLAPFMHHIPNVQMTLVGCSRDSVESVANRISDIVDSIVLPSPDKYALDYIAQNRESVIILPLVSQAPIQSVEGIPTPRLEKILVDILCDEPFDYLRGSESFSIYETAVSDYEINLQMLKRYAGRRNKQDEVNAILKELGL